MLTVQLINNNLDEFEKIKLTLESFDKQAVWTGLKFELEEIVVYRVIDNMLFSSSKSKFDFHFEN